MSLTRNCSTDDIINYVGMEHMAYLDIMMGNQECGTFHKYYSNIFLVLLKYDTIRTDRRKKKTYHINFWYLVYNEPQNYNDMSFLIQNKLKKRSWTDDVTANIYRL